ncbi:MAG: M20/M25/M40 family metallo-hydrolase [Erythrobacter sp.]|nr:M20/M25/M40 family metallo-hydrolase [Erythrobacter sp.]
MISRHFAALLCTAPLFVAVPAAAQLSPAEQVMVDTVEARYDSDVALLERLVAQNSGTHNHEGVRAVREMLVPELEALGFTVERVDQSAAGRAGHLFARHEGAPGTTRMLLIGHMDTVFEPSSPFQQVRREGDRLIGPGVVDDKGGVVVMLAALRAMQAAGTLDQANIVIALTGDEEDVGAPLDVARADLVAAGQWADVALGFESLAVRDGADMGTIARRSSNSWTLTTSGRVGHSSRVFSQGSGYGAIYELARILDAFRRELPQDGLTYNVGLVAGGTPGLLADDRVSASAQGKVNIIAGSAVARGDVRALTQEQTMATFAAMQAIVDQHLPGTDAEFAYELRYPAMAATAGNVALLDRLNAINADLGRPAMAPFPPSDRGAADISFVAPYADALAGMGPDGSNLHAEGEALDLETIVRQAQRAAILMSRLTAEHYAPQ